MDVDTYINATEFERLTMQSHKNIACLAIDIWPSIIEYIPFKSLLLILETGDKRIQHIRSAVRHLNLNRFQVKLASFPASFPQSWNRINSLTISGNNSIYQHLPTSSCLPSTLRCLTLYMNPESTFKMISLLKSLVANTTETSMLTDLVLKREIRSIFFDVDMVESDILREVVKKLSISSFVCNVGVYASVVSHLPPTLIHINTHIYGIKNASVPAPVFNSNLLTLCLEISTFAVSWESPLVIPPTVTDLNIKLERNNAIFNNLPSGLLSLHLRGCFSMDVCSISKLPTMLTSLTTGDPLDPELLSLLPVSLLTLKSSYAKGTLVDPRLLPPALIHIDMYYFPDSSKWMHLPRGLQYVGGISQLAVNRLADVPFLPNLPPSLTTFSVVTLPTSVMLRSIPSHRVLKSLTIRRFLLPSDLDFLSAFVPSKDDNVVFHSLKTLYVNVLSYTVDFMKDMYLPSLTHLTMLRDARFDDLSSIPVQSPLVSLELVCNEHNRLTNDCLKSSLLTSLPASLKSLKLNNHIIDASQWHMLPQNLVNLSFCTPSKSFSFEQLSELPNSIETLHFELVSPGNEMVRVLSPSLITILSSLPRSIRKFKCHIDRQCSLQFVLNDCTGPPEIQTELREKAFREYAPPFLREFMIKCGNDVAAVSFHC